MTSPDHQSLGALASIQQLLLQLVETLPPRDCNRSFDGLPSAGWLLGRAVYVELHLVRGVVMGDDDLAGRVRHLFADRTPPAESEQLLPPQEHLLNWAREALDQHLTWLANPGQLPAHALLEEGQLVWQLVQQHALSYERLLATITARSAHRERGDYQVTDVLSPQAPNDDSRRIDQGHYRIGERDGVGLANEKPAQLVELHSFRISRLPVTNSEYLAFMADGGYRDDGWWDDAGKAWRRESLATAPWGWRQDAQQQWYGIGTNGPLDLHPEDAVAGLSAHEARAYAAWASARGNGLTGAVPQHEYQWEVAARLGQIEYFGRSWEWCANSFHTYPDYQAPASEVFDMCPDDTEWQVLRGGCLHTQPSLRRSTFRRCALPSERALFAGTRLVMPPGKAAWE